MAPESGTPLRRRLPRLPGLLAGGMLACALFGALDWWLWHERHVHSLDLLFVQARAMLALGPSPPAGILLSAPPLVLYVTMLFGSAWMAAACCAALAVIVILGVVTWPRARFRWAFALLVQPVVVLGAIAYPARLLACALLTAALAEFVEYLRKPRLNPLTNAAVALAALVLVDWSLWPLWLLLVAGLALGLDTPRDERLTLCVVALFPALAVAGTWLYLNATETGWAWYFLEVPELALERMEPWASCPDPLACGISRSAAVSAAVPVVVLGALLALVASQGRDGDASEPRRARLGAGLILAAPLVLLLVRGAQGPGIALLDAGVLALASALAMAATARTTTARAVAWTFLAVIAASGWHGVIASGGEPRALLEAARTATPTPVTAPAVRVAGRFRSMRDAGDALLVDDLSMFPVVGLLDPGSWIPSSSWEFHLAADRPEPHARYVLQREDGTVRSRLHLPGEVLARSYDLVANEGGLRLYGRRADWGTEGSRR